jgi:hypothetical protein
MGRGGRQADWCGRRNHFAMSGKKCFHLDADFQADLSILALPVDRDVSTWPGNL